MEIITADFETYYSKDYSLTKLTTEAYIRDPRFEVIMLGLRWPDGRKELITGTHEEIQYRLDAIEWENFAVLCHNTMFDAAIFSWHFNVRPRAWLDTLSMGRAMFSARGNSLEMLAKRFGLGAKGTEVVNAMGLRRQDFSPEAFKRYADYCLNDVQLTYDLWHTMSEGWYNLEDFDNRGTYPLEELRLIDQHIRMFSEPVLRLNRSKLEAHLAGVIARKEELLSKTEFNKERLSSNPQFAEVLRELGVVPPTKISKTTGKTTWAFAKTDPELKALLEHPDERVQTAVAARLGTKSTLEETRTQTFIDIAGRNPVLPVPLKYSYARTKRSSGCLVDGTKVLVYDPSQRGVVSKRIVDVLADDLVWDGEAFVEHEGVQFSGYREVISWDGVTGTPEHVVFTESGEISLSEAMQRQCRIKTARDPSDNDIDSARVIAHRLRK